MISKRFKNGVCYEVSIVLLVMVFLSEELSMKRGVLVALEDLEGQSSPKRRLPSKYEDFLSSCQIGDVKKVEEMISSLAPEVIASNGNEALHNIH